MTIDGKRKIIGGTGKTREKAIEARSRAIAKALNGTTRTPEKKVRIGSLTAEMYAWNEARQVSQRTREKTASIIKNNIEAHTIGNKQLNTITKVDITQMLDSRSTQWTRVDSYKILRAFITNAIDNGKITTDPIQFIKKPQAPKAKGSNAVDMGKAIKRLKALLGWIRRTEWMNENPMYWSRILIALTGMRAGEARGLTWSEIQNLNGTDIPQIAKEHQLAVVGGKTTLTPIKNNQPRIIALYPEVVEALKAWRKVQNGYKRRKTWNPMKGMEDLVFTNEKGRPLRQQIDDAMWKALLTEQQKNYKTPVYWEMTYNRKIAISLIRDAGASRNMTATIMGHSPTVEDKYYYRSQIEKQAETMKLMSKWINPDSPNNRLPTEHQ
jgi:integrase